MDLARFPRIALGHLPTRLEFLPSLTRHLGGPRLFVKRDDCTGLALGGNKTRKLEFAVGAALEAHADLLITSGATQSNHVRQTAAAAAKLGLPCWCAVANPLRHAPAGYLETGNALLDEILGARLHVAHDTDGGLRAAVAQLEQSARDTGYKPWIIPVGASDAVGSLGYVACATELLEQCAQQGIDPSHVVVGTGSAGTHAGLLAGLRLDGRATKVVGVAVSETSAIKEGKVRALIAQLLALLGADPRIVANHDVRVIDRHVGEGYGIPAADTLEAVRIAAQIEGLILDPVYTGKAMAGLIALVRSGELANARDVVFLHTGGAPGVFAYAEAFRKPSLELES